MANENLRGIENNHNSLTSRHELLSEKHHQAHFETHAIYEVGRESRNAFDKAALKLEENVDDSIRRFVRKTDPESVVPRLSRMDAQLGRLQQKNNEALPPVDPKLLERIDALEKKAKDSSAVQEKADKAKDDNADFLKKEIVQLRKVIDSNAVENKAQKDNVSSRICRNV